MNRQLVLCIGSMLLQCLQGCALTGKGEALTPRYFSAEPAVTTEQPASLTHLELQLGEVSSASHLDERLAYRLSSSEVGFYDDRRWTEIPEAYVRRALERELFERRGVERIVSGLAPTLDVELTAFEELRGKPNKARVTLRFSLHDEQRSLLERSISVEREVRPGADPAERLAETLSKTLGDAVASLAAEVTLGLERARPVVPTTQPAVGTLRP